MQHAERMLEMLAENLHRPYPNKIAHSLESEADARPPTELTPLFYGCFDWHSAVHSHWAALSLLPHGSPSLAAHAKGMLDQSFTAEKVEGELAYLKSRPSFEMPYGMAWLLQLCKDFPSPVLEPLERLARERFQSWLENLPLPTRSGDHGQSAFAMGFALDYARHRKDSQLAHLLERKARQFYLADRNGPLGYEPSAYDFLSPTLAEADLMRRVLPRDEFGPWLRGFLPALAYRPVTPHSRTDGKLVHFDGLNLTRAWMLLALDPDLAEQHGQAGMTWLEGASYMGTHWLPSFSVYWLQARQKGSANPTR